MANNPGAKKRIRQNAVRRLRNRDKLSKTRTAIKKLRTSSEKSQAQGMLPTAMSLIDRCVKANLFHKNKAARLKGQLSKHVAALA